MNRLLCVVVLALVAAAPLTGSAVPAPLAINNVTIALSPGVVGTPLLFTVDASGDGLTYSWDFGDGITLPFDAAASSVSHTYVTGGHYSVVVRVRDFSAAEVLQTKKLLVHFPLTAVQPTNSSTIILDATNNRVWAVNSDQDTVSAMDTATNTVAPAFDNIRVGRHPRTLAQAADGRIWVLSQDDPTISILNETTGALEHVIPLPHGSHPYGICMTPDKTAAYVSFQGQGGVWKISTSTRAQLAGNPLPPTARGIAVTSAGHVLVTRFLSTVEPPLSPAQGSNRGEVVEFDASLNVVRTYPLLIDPGPGTSPDPDTSTFPTANAGRGVPNYLSTLVVSPDGRRAWVPGKKDNVQRGTSAVRDSSFPANPETTVRTIVAPLDLQAGTEKIAERIDVDNSDMAFAASMSPAGDYLFVAIQGTNRVQIRDAYTRASLNGTGFLTGGLSPQGLVLDPLSKKLYVSNFMSRNITVLDASAVMNLTGSDFTAPVVTTLVAPGADLLNVAIAVGAGPAGNVLAGKKVFYNAGNPQMSSASYISCATCHLDGGSDARVWDFTQRTEGLRNTTMLQGRAGTGHGNVHWTANFNEIQDFINDIVNAFGGTGFPAAVVPNPPMAANNAGNVDLNDLAAYVTSLNKVARSPWRNADGSLTASGERGEEIFNVRNCGRCHSGRNFTDSQVGTTIPVGPPAFPPAAGTVVLHQVGTVKPTSGNRLGTPLTNANLGIDTPTLKGVWQTAPYFHDGSAPTLMDVVTDSSRLAHFGFDPMTALTASERDDLVRYLLEIDELDAPATNSLTPAPQATINSVSTGKPYSLATVTPNGLAYIDRNYRLSATPAASLLFIRTAEDDKGVTTDNHLSITVPTGTDIYVVYDSRAASPPTWLTANWTPLPPFTERFFGQSDVVLNYWVRTTVDANPVVLGGNSAAGAVAGPGGVIRHYMVVLGLFGGGTPEGPLNQNEWAHDRDSDGDGLKDEFEALNTLSPWRIDTAAAGLISDEDTLVLGQTQFQLQAAFDAIVPAAPAAPAKKKSGGGGCGLLGLELLIPLALLRRLRRRRA